MLVEKIRKRMKGIIWFIVITFVLSIFLVGAASFYDNWLMKERRAEQAAQGAGDVRPDIDPEFNVMSTEPLAEVQMHSTTSVITEGQMNRMLISSDMVSQLRQLPEQFRSMYTDQFLEQLISQELMAIEARQQNVDVSLQVMNQMSTLINQNGNEAQFLTNIKRNGWKSVEELKEFLTKGYQVDALRSKLFEVVEVTDEEIELHYNVNRDTRYTSPDGKLIPLEQVKEAIRMELAEKATEEDLKAYYEKHKPRWQEAPEADFHYLVIHRDEPRNLESVEKSVDETAIAAYYEENKLNYLAPEKVDVQHILISRDELKKDIQVSDEEAQKFYDENQMDYTLEEMAKAAHILIKTEEMSKEEALEKITGIRSQILAGEVSFEDAAKEHSEDPGSGSRGGDLGSFPRGQMVEPFEEYCFNGPIGEISEPIETRFGYHIIRVDERNEETVKPLSEVRELVNDEVRDGKVKEVADARMEAIRTQLRSGLASFAQMVQKHSHASSKEKDGRLEGLYLGEGNPEGVEDDLSSGGEGIDYPVMVTIRTLKIGEVSEPVETTKGWHLFKLLKQYEPEVLPLEAVREKVEESVLDLKLEENYKKRIAEVQLALEAKTDLKSLIKSHSDSHEGEMSGTVVQLTLEPGHSLDVYGPQVAEDLGMGTRLHRKVYTALRYLPEGSVSSSIDLGGRTIFAHKTKAYPVGFKSFEEVRDEVEQAVSLKVNEEDVVNYFEENKEKFATKAQTTIQQIYYLSQSDAQAQLKAINEGLLSFDVAGKSKMNADQANFVSNEGKYNLTEVGFEEADREEIQSLEPGQLLKRVVKSPFGFHIVKMHSKVQGSEPNLEAVRAQIVQELKEQKKGEVLSQYAQELRNKAERIRIF